MKRQQETVTFSHFSGIRPLTAQKTVLIENSPSYCESEVSKIESQRYRSGDLFMSVMKNIGVRLSDDLIQKLEARSTVTGEDKAGICRNAIALVLGEPVPPSSDERFQDIIDRLSRLESLILQICPSENGQEGSSNESAVGLDVQISPYLLSEWVNEEQMIICPRCGSTDSDWADDDEANSVRSILCHQCGQTSHFDLSA